MSYQQVKNLKPEDFKRLSGVRQETFTQMLEVVRAHTRPKKKTGRPGKLSLEDQLLMTFYHLYLPDYDFKEIFLSVYNCSLQA